MPSRKRVALVIGSGNLKCAAVLGVMKVLQREGIEVSMAVGCSGGSPFAAALALGYGIEETERRLKGIWKRELYTRYHYPSLLRLLAPRLFGSSGGLGLVDDSRLMHALEEGFGDLTFQQTRIPLYIVATDILNGEKVVLSEGSIVGAIRASVALPIVFQPWELEGRMLVDGGASDPLPVDVAIREGADVILALGFETPYTSQAASLTGVVRQASTIMMNNLIRSTYSFYNLAHHAEIIPIIPRFDRPIGLADTHLFPYIIEEGERAAEAEAPYLRRLLAPESSGSLSGGARA
jgi:NTE family protein